MGLHRIQLGSRRPGYELFSWCGLHSMARRVLKQWAGASGLGED